MISPQKLEALRELAAEGTTRREAADELGLTFHQVKHAALANGIRFQKYVRRNVYLACEVLSLVNECGNAEQIAKRIKRSGTLVRRWIKRLEKDGLVIRKGRGKTTRLKTSRLWTAKDV